MAHDLSTPGDRLVSLDAYRGFIMLLMASGGLGLAKVAAEFPDSPTWQILGYQSEHVPWIGCTIWDLIQPSFMFMVGVAIPFSHASRLGKGQSRYTMALHVGIRAFLLVALGVFLASNGARHTNFTFTNVLAQIGLGYPFVYILVGRGARLQLAAIAVILVGYWLLFYLYAAPPVGLDSVALHLPDAEGRLEGLWAHWSKHTNAAASFDRWFLAWFPHSDMLPYNKGGYQTLNWVPSMATMLFGLLAGELLRGASNAWTKVKSLAWAAGICLLTGVVLGSTACPLVKRIWTPSWAIFSAGWCFLMLAAFYYMIDYCLIREWSLPLVVVGMNSIAIYLMSQLMRPWLTQTFKTHVGSVWGTMLEQTTDNKVRMDMESALGTNLVGGIYGPIVQSATILAILWLICWGLYRRRIFLRL